MSAKELNAKVKEYKEIQQLTNMVMLRIGCESIALNVWRRIFNLLKSCKG